MRFTLSPTPGPNDLLVSSTSSLKSRLVSAASRAVTSGSVRQPASLSSLHAPLLSWGALSSPRARTCCTISPSGRGTSRTLPMLCTAVLPAARCLRGCETHQLGAQQLCARIYTAKYAETRLRRPCESLPWQLAPLARPSPCPPSRCCSQKRGAASFVSQPISAMLCSAVR
jgi:hypothetical protein